MPGVISRVWALIIKEFLVVLREPRGRVMLVAPAVMQLILFSTAATLEVKNVSLAVFNEDRGRHGLEMVQRLGGSKTFSDLVFTSRAAEFEKLLDERRVMAAVHIPQDFSRAIESGAGARLQVVFDGRKSNSTQITNSYLTQIVNGYNRELSLGSSAPAARVAIVGRYWFNENLEYVWFTIPSLVGILTVVITICLSALSVSRERELGTFDQLLVSPLLPVEILAGKLVPAMVIGMVEALFIFFMGRLLFDVPFRGSFILLLLVIALFSYSIVGAGLFISSLAKTQQQAILGAFIFIVPAVSLSGFSAPVENMPLWLQKATWINPMKHALIVFKGLFLKDMPFHEVLAETWPLAVIGTATLVFAGWMFSRKLE